MSKFNQCRSEIPLCFMSPGNHSVSQKLTLGKPISDLPIAVNR